MKNQNLQVGSCVVIGSFYDSEFDISLKGWQGRIIDLEQQDKLVLVQWDSITLQNMPLSIIDRCEEDRLCWDSYEFKIKNVAPTAPRDNEEDVEKVFYQRVQECYWQRKGVDKIISNAKRRKLVIFAIVPFFVLGGMGAFWLGASICGFLGLGPGSQGARLVMAGIFLTLVIVIWKLVHIINHCPVCDKGLISQGRCNYCKAEPDIDKLKAL